MLLTESTSYLDIKISTFSIIVFFEAIREIALSTFVEILNDFDRIIFIVREFIVFFSISFVSLVSFRIETTIVMCEIDVKKRVSCELLLLLLFLSILSISLKRCKYISMFI